MMLTGTSRARVLGAGIALALSSGGMIVAASTPATATAAGTVKTVASTETAAAAARPKVDLVFAIDTTGSMGPYIAAVQDSARKITDLLFATADARVALVDYKDLYRGCAADGYAAQVDLPFTADAAAFGPSVDGLSASGGCDFPESVYSGIMTGLELPWRSDARRSLLVMGDAPPHDPEPVTGYTHDSVTAAANAGGVVVTPGSPATPAPTAARAAAAETATAETAAAPPVSLYTVNINGGASPYFESLAEDTAGESYPASDPTEAVEQIAAAITDITSGDGGGGDGGDTALTVDAGGPYEGAAGEPVTFTAGVSGGAGAVTGYEWDFDDNGTYDATTAVPSIVHTYPKPYTGRIGLRVSTGATPPETATDTADVRILTRVRVKYIGQRSGLSGKRARLQAYVSGPKNTKLKGVPVVFTLGDAGCTGTTNADGQASCEVVTPVAHGTLPVTAAADAGPGYVPGSTTEDYVIKEPQRRDPTPAPTTSAPTTPAPTSAPPTLK